MHFGGDDCASEDTASDGDLTSEGTFLVCRIKLDIVHKPFTQSSRRAALC